MTATTPKKNVWSTIPILPCVLVLETLAFWESLEFKITYKQTRPYQYGVVERNGSSLHFAGLKGLTAADNYHTGCLVVVDNSEEEYQKFSSHLKKLFGRVPHTGIPRISRMKPGATRFTLTDVSGNAVIFVSRGKKDQEVWEQAEVKTGSKLQNAMAKAKRYRDYKNDDGAAAKTLDNALKTAMNNDPDLPEALVMRIELAVQQADQLREQECRQQLATLGLDHYTHTVLEERHKTN